MRTSLLLVHPYVFGITPIPVLLPVRVSSQSREGFLRPCPWEFLDSNFCSPSPARLSKVVPNFSTSQSSLLELADAHRGRAPPNLVCTSPQVHFFPDLGTVIFHCPVSWPAQGYSNYVICYYVIYVAFHNNSMTKVLLLFLFCKWRKDKMIINQSS